MADSDEQELQARLERARAGELDVNDLRTLRSDLQSAGKVHDALEVATLVITLVDAKLSEEKAKLSEEKAKISEEVAEIKVKHEYAVARTIEKIYRRDNRPSFPALKLNTEVSPSIAGHNLRGMDPQTAKYEDGISGCEFWEKLNEIVVPTTFSGGQLATSEFNPQDFPLNYLNEIEIQFNVQKLVRDAIQCMSCQGILEPNLEISFYGITPDIVVVCQNRKIIFVIEVKAPNRPGTTDNVFRSDLVAGQIWLYLMAMRQAGNPNPLGAICTFNQIRLVSLKDMSEHAFKDALAKLKQDTVTTWEPEQEELSKDKPTPDPKRQSASDKSKRFDYEDPGETFDGEIAGGGKIFKAKLFGGETVSTNSVFPMLLLGLTTAKIEAGVQGGSEEMLTEVGEGDDLSFRQLAYTTDERITFGRTPGAFKVSKECPHHKCKNFYLLDSIGVGHKGQVSLAMSTTGAIAAVKFFHFKPSREATEEKRRAETKKLIEKAQEKRDAELERWKTLYPARKARAIKLGGLPCLLMPYGTRIPQGERGNFLNIIRGEIERFCELKFVYRKSDLRWRNVLRNFEGDIFLADLGSLDEGTKDNSAIEEHMTYLREKMKPASDDGDKWEKKPAAGPCQGDNKRESGTKRGSSGKESLLQKKKKRKAA